MAKYNKGDRVMTTVDMWNNAFGRAIAKGSIVTVECDTGKMCQCSINGIEAWYEYEWLGEVVENASNIPSIPNTRPCMVTLRDEEPKRAEFHKWIEDTTVFLKFNRTMKAEHMRKNIDEYFRYNVLPADNTLEKITNTVALVELEDGTVKKVDPESVRFIKE